MTYASGYGVRVDAIVLEKLGELHDAPRYQDKGAFLETTHDGQGFYLERGGFWNDTEGRAATGVTKTDVRDVRAALGRMGIRLTVDQVVRSCTRPNARSMTSANNGASVVANASQTCASAASASFAARFASRTRARASRAAGKPTSTRRNANARRRRDSRKR